MLLIGGGGGGVYRTVCPSSNPGSLSARVWPSVLENVGRAMLLVVIGTCEELWCALQVQKKVGTDLSRPIKVALLIANGNVCPLQERLSPVSHLLRLHSCSFHLKSLCSALNHLAKLAPKENATRLC